MRSDTPKVLHTLAGRSMLSHAVHTVANAGRPTSGGRTRPATATASPPRSASWPTSWAAPSTSPSRTSSWAPATPSACGLSSLPDEFTGTVVVTSGDVPLLDADTLADLIETHSAATAAATVLTTTVPDPTGYGRILRTQDNEVIGIVEQADATESQRAIREVNAGVYAFDIADLRSALSRLSSNNAQQELYLTDVIAIVRQDGRTGAGHARRRQRAGRRRQRPGAARPIWAPSSTAASWPAINAPVSRSSTRPPPGSTSTSPSAATPSSRREPNCWAPPRSVPSCEIGPDSTLTDVEVGDGASVVRTHGSSP